MDTKYKIALGVLGTTAAAVGIYFMTRKPEPPANTFNRLFQQSIRRGEPYAFLAPRSAQQETAYHA